MPKDDIPTLNLYVVFPTLTVSAVPKYIGYVLVCAFFWDCIYASESHVANLSLSFSAEAVRFLSQREVQKNELVA